MFDRCEYEANPIASRATTVTSLTTMFFTSLRASRAMTTVPTDTPEAMFFAVSTSRAADNWLMGAI
jgi:hypothetical protein